jgi:glycerol-3-phosphate acyltransferase PlsX
VSERIIALDAFGSDNCPDVEVEAAVIAARGGHSIILVGDQPILERSLGRFDGVSRLPLRIHHASETIVMDDSPAKAVRGKPDASMPVCFDLVRRGEANAVISAGNSGAMLACGLFKFGRIKGVDRPAIVNNVPGPRSSCALLDMGANVECKPLNLVQFAVMGAAFATCTQGKARPRVGVLANGSEEGKGTDLTRAAHRLLREGPSAAFSYVGYVEGKDLFSAEVDVVITDGFTGNIALKVLEGTARALVDFLRDAIRGSRMSKLGALLMRPAFKVLKQRVDPDSYGGAPLLGVRGIAIICHGGATPRAMVNAVRLTDSYLKQGLTPGLCEAISAHTELFVAAKAAEGDPRKTNESS